MNDDPDQTSGPSADAEATAAMLEWWEDLELRREPTGLAHRILVLLEHFGRLSPGGLARLLHIPTTSLSRMTAQLARAGLVTSAPAPGDGRGRIVTATPAGLQLLAELRAERLAEPSPLLPEHAENEAVRAGLAGLLAALHKSLRDHDGDR
ncbi:MarR family transcriptional regulator [Streptomyces bikiniensis]|uniref:MarR family transcriptional regulator n=1 Tax=Streptomyces bikiniensis TaxID=1896 RepID=UPI00068B7897|nr:MarR family transcriptional regulator [Streptomyces bikiniensis]